MPWIELTERYIYIFRLTILGVKNIFPGQTSGMMGEQCLWLFLVLWSCWYFGYSGAGYVQSQTLNVASCQRWPYIILVTKVQLKTKDSLPLLWTPATLINEQTVGFNNSVGVENGFFKFCQWECATIGRQINFDHVPGLKTGENFECCHFSNNHSCLLGQWIAHFTPFHGSFILWKVHWGISVTLIWANFKRYWNKFCYWLYSLLTEPSW